MFVVHSPMITKSVYRTTELNGTAELRVRFSSVHFCRAVHGYQRTVGTKIDDLWHHFYAR